MQFFHVHSGKPELWSLFATSLGKMPSGTIGVYLSVSKVSPMKL